MGQRRLGLEDDVEGGDGAGELDHGRDVARLGLGRDGDYGRRRIGAVEQDGSFDELEPFVQEGEVASDEGELTGDFGLGGRALNTQVSRPFRFEPGAAQEHAAGQVDLEFDGHVVQRRGVLGRRGRLRRGGAVGFGDFEPRKLLGRVLGQVDLRGADGHVSCDLGLVERP